MKRTALFLVLLLSFSIPAWAEYVELSDGRVCKDCIVSIDKGFVVSVKDKNGYEWVDQSVPLGVNVITHSRLWPINHNYTTPAGFPIPVSHPEQAIFAEQPSFMDKFVHNLGTGLQSYANRPRTNMNCMSYGNNVNCTGY